MSLLPITQGNSRTLALVNQWGHKGKLLSPNLKYVEDHTAHKGGLGAGEQNAPGGLRVPPAHRPWWLSQPPVVPMEAAPSRGAWGQRGQEAPRFQQEGRDRQGHPKRLSPGLAKSWAAWERAARAGVGAFG